MISRLQWVTLPLFLFALGGLIAYLGWMWFQPSPPVMHGLVSVYHYDPIHPYTGGGCTREDKGYGEFADLQTGAPVIIMDEVGNVLADTKLGPPSNSLSTCWFAFAADSVPEAESYQIKIGDREPQTFTREEIARHNWEVTLDFGGR